MRRIVMMLAVLLGVAPGALAQQVKPIVHVLDNGMTVLLVPRTGDPNISAGWIAKVGSVNEHPGITGVAHLFEHMMFKGTDTIGTIDARRGPASDRAPGRAPRRDPQARAGAAAATAGRRDRRLAQPGAPLASPPRTPGGV